MRKRTIKWAIERAKLFGFDKQLGCMLIFIYEKRKKKT